MDRVLLKLQDDIDESIDRYKSILTIPRRKATMVEDIELILKLVEDNPGISDQDLTLKIIRMFKVSRNTACNVRPTLERANLLMKTNDIVKLTQMAKLYLKNRDVCYLAKGFIYSYFGFLEILYLVKKESPSKKTSILNEWIELYNKEFGERSEKTHRQQFFRAFRYLNNLNFIHKVNGVIMINEGFYKKLEDIQYI